VISSLLCPQLWKVLALLACAWQQPAGDKAPPPDKKIKVTVVVVLACERGNDVAKELKCLADAVRVRYPELKSFRIESMKCKDVAENERVAFLLPEDKKAEIVIHCAADHKKKVCMAVAAPTLGEIEYGTVCGKFLAFVTRYYTRENERIVLAVRVQPCPCPKK
jgi:hypothetical protein